MSPCVRTDKRRKWERVAPKDTTYVKKREKRIDKEEYCTLCVLPAVGGVRCVLCVRCVMCGVLCAVRCVWCVCNVYLLHR